MQGHTRYTSSPDWAPAFNSATPTNGARGIMQIAESMGLSEAWTNPMSASKLTSQDPTAIEKEQQRLKEQERTIAPPTVVIVATPALLANSAEQASFGRCRRRCSRASASPRRLSRLPSLLAWYSPDSRTLWLPWRLYSAHVRRQEPPGSVMRRLCRRCVERRMAHTTWHVVPAGDSSRPCTLRVAQASHGPCMHPAWPNHRKARSTSLGVRSLRHFAFVRHVRTACLLLLHIAPSPAQPSPAQPNPAEPSPAQLYRAMAERGNRSS